MNTKQKILDVALDLFSKKGYVNVWSSTTVVYGALWTLICSIISFFSFGSIDFGLLVFKLFNFGIHIGKNGGV